MMPTTLPIRHWGTIRILSPILHKYQKRRSNVLATSAEIGVLAIVAIWLAIAIKHIENRANDLAAATRNITNFTLLFEENVSRAIGEADKALRYMRRSIEDSDGTIDYRKLVKSPDLLSEIIVQVAIIDEDGIMRATSADNQALSTIDLSDREHYRVHRFTSTDDLFISRPLLGRASGRLSIQLTRRFLSKEGKFGGVVVVSVDPSYFQNVLQRVALGAGGSSALIGTDGVIRSVSSDDPSTISRTLEAFKARALQPIDQRTSGAAWKSLPTHSNKGKDLVEVSEVTGFPLAVIARLPYSSVYTESYRALLAMLLVGSALSVLTGWLSYQGYQHEMQDRKRLLQLRRSNTALKIKHDRLTLLHDRLRESEADARRQQALFEGVFESAPDGILHLDANLSIVHANRAFFTVTGYTSMTDVRQSPLQRLLDDPLEISKLMPQNETDALLGSPSPAHTVVQCIRHGGQRFPAQISITDLIDLSGTKVGYICIIRDVSVQQRREEAIREQQRLEALGRLTGGIAHDFNNLLTVISGNLQLMELEVQNEAVTSYIEQANRATAMGARLNHRLMAFARQQRLDPQVHDLNELIRSLAELVTSSIGEKIALTTELCAQSAWSRYDASEMENAVINLVLNARDAMPDGGKLEIRTSNITRGDGPGEEGSGGVPGTYIRLTVSDNGVGMTREVVSHAFEPYFTTRERGGGTGLGLTTVHGFVNQSGGQIFIESEVGQGTTVTIDLPVAHDAVILKKPAGNTARAPRGSNQLILIVEDNADVLRVVRGSIRALGYQTVEAKSASEALDIIERREGIELVYSDIVMPGAMSGIDLAHHLSLIRPDLPVVLTSGFHDQPKDEHIVVLRKPFTQDELARRIAEVLRS